MTWDRILRPLFRLPLLRSLRLRRWLWDRRNDLLAVRRGLFERLGSERYSRPALHGLDRALERYLPQRGGFFVEAGAYDGFIQSNTYWLERFRDWQGVLVEPVPHLYEQARRRRPGCRVVNCALVPPEHGEPHVRMRYGGLMSLVVGARGAGADELDHVLAGDMHGLDDVAQEMLVPASTLTRILDDADAPWEPDLLSLDVEGYEADVLRGLDLERYRFRFMVIEMDDPRRAAIERVIGDRYELAERLSRTDFLYVRTDHQGRE